MYCYDKVAALRRQTSGLVLPCFAADDRRELGHVDLLRICAVLHYSRQLFVLQNSAASELKSSGEQFDGSVLVFVGQGIKKRPEEGSKNRAPWPPHLSRRDSSRRLARIALHGHRVRPRLRLGTRLLLH